MQFTHGLLLSGIAGSVLLLGCSRESKVPAPPLAKDKTEQHNHEDAHPSHGPHDGDLVELGDEEYHAEFVHDEKTKDVTIYVLDASAIRSIPIDAAEVVINLKHDGKPEQYKLAAEPQEGDGPGKSSRFMSKQNDELCHAIEEEGADAKLQLTIDGKPFTGAIQHDHDHEGHDHEQTNKEHGAHEDKKK